MGKYIPGESGNPKGRPKNNTDTVVSLAQQHTEAAIQTLVDIMKTSKKTSSRIAAAKAILDRGWGRPAQAVTLKGDSDSPVTVQVIKFGNTTIEF